MSDSREDIFDLEIKAALEDATEDVPEHIWTAVSDRLDAIDNKRTKRREAIVWVRRVGIGLAAAAAVVLGIFLFVSPDKANYDDDLLAVITESEADSRADGVSGSSEADSRTDGVSGSGEADSRTAIVPDGREANSQATVVGGVVADDSAQETVADRESAQQGGSLVELIEESEADKYIARTEETSDESEAEALTANAGPDNIVEAAASGADRTEALEETQVDNSEALAGTEALVEAEALAEAEASAGTEISGSEVLAETEAAVAWNDPFADDPWEDRRQRTRPRAAITMSGNALSNSGISSSSSSSDRLFASSIIQQAASTGVNETSESNYNIPLSFGIGTKITFTPRWSVGIGVNYTLLSRKFSGIYTEYADDGETYTSTTYTKIRNIQSYVGIPINVYYSILSSKVIDFYVYAGGTGEKCVSNKYRMDDNCIYKESVKGLQFSVDGGIGMEFIIVDMVGLYIDPSIRYYFENSKQPTSIRTQQPLSFGVELGFRIRL